MEQQPNDAFENLIPAQYRGLPADVVEELWVNPTFTDPEKNRRESERRERALQALRAQEQGVQQEEKTETQEAPTESTEKYAEVQRALERLDQDCYLIVHQTFNDSAQKITERDAYFADAGLVGTSLMVRPDAIMKVIPELDKPTGRTMGNTHKGSNAMVIMAVPRSLVDEHSTKTNEKGLAAVDDLLIDRIQNGKQSQFGLPNQFIYGYYFDGAIHQNKNFHPAFTE